MQWEPVPNRVEYPGKEIGNRTMVQSKILTRDKDSTVYRQAKKGFFCLIKSFYINGIHLVIGIYAHPVIRNAEYEKRQQRHCNLRVICPAKNNTKNTPAIRKCSGRSPIQTAVRIRKNAVMTITSTASLTEGNKLFFIPCLSVVYSNAPSGQMPSNSPILQSLP